MSRAHKLFETQMPDTVNRDGYPAYVRPLEEQYLQTLLTNTMGQTYYVSQEELLQEADGAHRAMSAKDPGFAARALVFARNEGLMRLQPLCGLAHLSRCDPELFARVFPRVVLIPSDLADFLTILKGMGRGEGGRMVKRAVAGFLNKVSEYWAIKYNGRGRGYSLGDIVATAHPKPADEKQRQLFRYLTGQDYDRTLLPQVAAYEDLQQVEDEAERIALIGRGRLPHEVVTGAVKPTAGIWEAILREMPLMALLRHLRALDRAGVLERNRSYVVRKLTDMETLVKSRILPFRFLKAFDQVDPAWVRDILRQAAELAFINLPELPGRTAVFLDVSGSMQGDFLRIGAVFALALYKRTDGSGYFWLFDTMVIDARPSKQDSILSQAERIRAGGSTDTGAPVAELLRQKIKVDNIIMITDEQQNTGSPFTRVLTGYRKAINPAVKAFIIDIAPYRQGMVSPADGQTWYIYGWSETILHFIAYAIQGYGGMVDRVRKIEL